MSSKLKELIKTYLPAGARIVRRVESLFRYRLTARKARHLLRRRADLWVEVGAGDKAGENGWLTIDRTPRCDLFWDLRKGLPFPDGSVRKIYSSHFFEHLSFEETQSFLAECRRTLSAGGQFSICVPNARLYLEAYVHGVTLVEERYFTYGPAYHRTTRIDYVNYTAYMAGEHKYMFDEKNLLFLLTKAGFRHARLREFDPELDRADRDYESIYAAAEK